MRRTLAGAFLFSLCLYHARAHDAPCCPSSLPFFSLDLSPSTITMARTPPESPSCSNYQVIFDSALEAYKKKTGKDLTSDPLLCSLETCHSPDSILAVLRAQIRVPSQLQSSSDESLTWLNPTINVLNAFSATIGSGVGLVRLEWFEVARPEFVA